MPVPLATVLRAGPRASAPMVARGIARALAPEEAEDPAPPWLRPGQRVAFRRVLAAVRRHGGALLADPVGSGKTWVAIAVAEHLAHGSGQGTGAITCLVPAALCSQWKEVLQRTGVRGVVHSHEMASRGRLPDTSGPVVIDESHRFRNPATRRYAHVAGWLLARPAILLSATPVVNRGADVTRQLLLCVRDDALAAYGVPSLAVTGAAHHPALGALVLARSEVAGLPAEQPRRVEPGAAPGVAGLLAGLDRLRLSTDAGVAALVRTGLVRALASSTAAFAGALGRYQALLLQARDAHDAGRVAGRSLLRALGGGDATQLVMWALLPQPEGHWDLALDDADRLDDLAREARAALAEDAGDPRPGLLAALVGDGRPTIVFTAFRETVLALRSRLPRAAWVTGDRAGVGPVRTTRAAALTPFRRTEGPTGREPRVLLATDVAAEGLDLRGVSRVVHYDLPWTDVRLVQRAGRARRLDARHAAVDVVTFAPAAVLEPRLGTGAAVARKRGLAKALVESPDWRWAAALAEHAADDAGAVEGVASVRVADPAEAGVLAGLVVEEAGEPARTVTWWLGWRPEGARADAWSPARHDVAPRLAALLAAAAPGPAGRDDPLVPAVLARITSELAGEAARLLRRAAAARLGSPPRTPGAAPLRRRALAEAAGARRRRDGRRLALLESWLEFLGRGHTAGEARLIADLAAAGTGKPAFAGPPPGTWPRPAEGTGSPGALGVRLTGLVVFRAGGC